MSRLRPSPSLVVALLALVVALGGTAYAAGLAVGFWKTLDALRSNWKADRQWEPAWSVDQRETAFAGWKKAVEKSFGWSG